jgi:hypothetical protein
MTALWFKGLNKPAADNGTFGTLSEWLQRN